MRAERGRTKKLIVAFHFQFSNPAGWKCDDCRRNGLETKRQCGRTGGPGPGTGPRAVWARGRAVAASCPKTLIDGETAAWLHAYSVWKRFGFPDMLRLPARDVEAMTVLEQEFQEMSRGQQ